MKTKHILSCLSICTLLMVASAYGQNYKTLSQNVLLEDRFYSNTNGWPTSGYNVSASIGGGLLSVEELTDKQLFFVIPLSLDESRDFMIETRMAYKSGGAGQGLIMGYQSDNTHLRYIATDRDGQIYVQDKRSGVDQVIQRWTAVSAMEAKRQAMNTYTIEKIGSRLKFYMNGTEVASTTFKRSAGAKYGFFVGGKTKFTAEYFKVAYLDGQANQFVNTYNPTNYNQNNYNQNNYSAGPSIELREPLLERGFKSISLELLRVAGFAKTNAGLNSVMINGVMAYLGPEGYFSAQVPVRSGANTITITATDQQQKTAVKTFSVTR